MILLFQYNNILTYVSGSLCIVIFCLQLYFNTYNKVCLIYYIHRVGVINSKSKNIVRFDKYLRKHDLTKIVKYAYYKTVLEYLLLFFGVVNVSFDPQLFYLLTNHNIFYCFDVKLS